MSITVKENKTKINSVKKGTFFKSGKSLYMMHGKTSGNFYLDNSASSYFEAINVRTGASSLFPGFCPVKVIKNVEITLK